MKKFNCEYRDLLDDSGNLISMSVEAETPKEAYEKFIETVGAYPKEVVVGEGILHTKIFDNHKWKSETDKEEDIIKKINKNNEEKNNLSSEEKISGYNKTYEQLPTDEKMLFQLEMMREEVSEVRSKLSNLKWVIFTVSLAILLTLQIGGVVIKNIN